MLVLVALPLLPSATLAASGSPFPAVLPLWEPSYAMNRSTLAMPSNSSGFFDPQLAAKFGLVSFDHGNNRAGWLPQMGSHSCATPSSEELMVEQCSKVKAINPLTKCFVYRNGQLALQWLSSEAGMMYNASAADLFLRSTSGAIYNDPAQRDSKPGSGLLDQYFFNFSVDAMQRFWEGTLMLGPNAMASPHVDGFVRCLATVAAVAALRMRA